MIKRCPPFVILLLFLLTPVQNLRADEDQEEETKDPWERFNIQEDREEKASYPWKRFNIQIGGFISEIDSSVSFGTDNVGLLIDVEDLLGIESSTTVFRVDGNWRFTDNRRHRLDFGWFSWHRSGNTQLLDDINIGGLEIPAGTTLSTELDLDIIQAHYSYSFLQDDRVDLALGLGLYVAPFSFKYDSSGLLEAEDKESFIAPLPVLGLRGDFVLVENWYLRNNIDAFFMKYQNFKGGLLSASTSLEYTPFENFGLGLGFESFRIRVQADGGDWPGIDFRGKMNYQTVGLLFYIKFMF